jgi:hypothetical protein
MAASFAHEVNVHEGITRIAEDSAFMSSQTYASFLMIVSSDCDRQRAVDSMVAGSIKEDETWKDEGGIRTFNHFYDPLTRLGLSNWIPDDRIEPFGTNSFMWGSTLNCPGIDFFRTIGNLGINVNTQNRWSWGNARSYQWVGLTAKTPSARQIGLTNTFRSIGQVVHLLQDASQPQHTRNEQHLPYGWRSPIEAYGGDPNHQLNFQHGLLPWRADGFTKLEDFWNRGKYSGLGSSELVADASASGVSDSRLGLAEFSNGNFLGAHHLFPEYYSPGKVQYYPFPSRNRSTTYSQVLANPAYGVDNFTLENGHQGRGIYLRKNADGTPIRHISRVNYLGAKIRGLEGPTYCTINDPNVLQDYHDILIPKAVEYSAGLLDYFFRGKIDVCLGLGASPGVFTLQIVNQSGQDLQGGGFHLFYDDSNGNRTELTGSQFSTSYSGALADGGTITAQFTAPAGQVAQYMLVYKGTIGSAGGTAVDPVDSGIAIAAKVFSYTSVMTPPPTPWCTSPQVSVQCLVQQKNWKGFTVQVNDIYWYDGILDPDIDVSAVIPPDPITVSYRRNFRRRWNTMAAAWSFNASSYHLVDTILGSGYVEVSGSQPCSISGDPAVFSGDCSAWQWQGWWTVDDSWYAPRKSGVYGWTTWDGRYVDQSFAHADQDVTEQLSGEVLFPPNLATAANRLLQRTFPDFTGAPLQFLGERFNEADNDGTGSASDPAQYDMSPQSANLGIDFVPWFGAVSPDRGNYLASFWFTPTEEESGTGTVAEDALAMHVQAVRTRFKPTSPTTCFVCEAKIVHCINPFQNSMTSSLADVHLVDYRTLMADEIYELPLPYSPNDDFVEVAGTLSNGRIRFAILGETPAHWTARTGIPIQNQ